MPWIDIPGYRWPYRIDEDGTVQKYYRDKWSTVAPCIRGRRRLIVFMQTQDGKRKAIPVVNLMADAFMGGRKPGTAIVHKSGARTDCSLKNLVVIDGKKAGLLSCRSRRRPVEQVDMEGNVVAVYPSVIAAANACYISSSAVQARCARKVSDPYRLNGYTYRYEK